jgi:phosphoserine aminotransferase
VNIAAFGLGREAPGESAYTCLTVDDAVTSDVIDMIHALPGLFDVQAVTLPSISGMNSMIQPRLTPNPPEPTNTDDDIPPPPTTTTTTTTTSGGGNGLKSVGACATTTSTSIVAKPDFKVSNPRFSSGPTSKRPGWSFDSLKDAAVGRSHRAKVGKDKLKLAIDETKRLLEIPDDYKVGIVPASDTGAFEMAMWSMLGPREVDVMHWEAFGKGWFGDATKELKLNVTEHTADYGDLPDLTKVDTINKDVLFTWNGTTSGVCLPHGDWIDSNRKGLTMCDATSAVFAMNMPWEKLDVTTYSWQKVLGGEGGHGMLVLSPRAVERLESYTPNWPLPKIFRLTKGGKLIDGIFKGATINTPSMICVEDYLDALHWVHEMGGLQGTIQRANENLSVLERFVESNDWIHFLSNKRKTLSNTSVCFTVDLPSDKIKEMITLLEKEEAAFDISPYRDAPDGLRIWAGATVEKKDLEDLTHWLQWAYHSVKP